MTTYALGFFKAFEGFRWNVTSWQIAVCVMSEGKGGKQCSVAVKVACCIILKAK